MDDWDLAAYAVQLENTILIVADALRAGDMPDACSIYRSEDPRRHRRDGI